MKFELVDFFKLPKVLRDEMEHAAMKSEHAAYNLGLSAQLQADKDIQAVTNKAKEYLKNNYQM